MAKADIIPARAADIPAAIAVMVLPQLESIMERSLALAYYINGLSLLRIRDGKTEDGQWLYSAEGYPTFEDYCRRRWQMETTHANRLISSARVIEILAPIGAILPRNEAVARPLTRLLGKPDEPNVGLVREVWAEILRRAPKDADGNPIVSAKFAEEIVKEYLQPTEQPDTFPGRDYRVLYADPPWKYSDTLIEGYGAADHHYPQMTIMELCEMKDEDDVHVSDCALGDAVLFMWVTSPLLQDAFQVVDAWRFDYKTSFVWDKVKHNFGHYNSVRHELLLICTRGSCTPDVKKLHDSVVSIERTGKHSEKPERFYEIIEELYPAGKRIELFARKARPNWDAYGNQLAGGHGQ